MGKTAGLDSIPKMDPRDSGADTFLAIKLTVLDLQVKQEECESRRIKLRVIDAERERDSEWYRHVLEALKRDLYFRLAPLREPLLTARTPSQTNETFILVMFDVVLLFEMTGGNEE